MPAANARQFVTALFSAFLLHVVAIISVTFAEPESANQKTSTLSVVLVHNPSEEAPTDAGFLAQANQAGAGEQVGKGRPTAPAPLPNYSQRAPIVTPATQQSRPATPETLKRPMAVTQKRPSKLQTARQPPRPRPRPSHFPHLTEPSSLISSINLDAEAAEFLIKNDAHEDLVAEIDRRLGEYAARPRRKWLTAKARESKYAAYMDTWRAKVERIGNLNYPSAARRQRLNGNLLLDVSINADGTVEAVSLRRSSGHRALDDAAVAIVKLAAPFARFPADIRRDTDVLHIERTWQFHATHGITSR